MSLLIKALDNAEKNKKAEKTSKVADDKLAVSPVLELQAIEPSLSNSTSTKTNAADGKSEALARNVEEKSLSLEEEAGLSTSLHSNTLDPKYAKPKRSTDKTPEKNPKQSVGKIPSETVPNLGLQEPTTSHRTPVLPQVFQTIAAQNNDHHQKAAAKVFVANQSVKTNSSKSALVILGIAGALMIWLGLQGYTYLKPLLIPAETVVIKPATPNSQDMATVAADAAQISQAPVTEAQAIETQVTQGNTAGVNSADSQSQAVAINDHQSRQSDIAATMVESTDDAVVRPSSESNNFAVAKSNSKTRSTKKVNEDVLVDEDMVSPAKTPIKLVSKPSVNGVDPTLLSAYQAFNRGEDALAQQQYRQVLQRDVRNVDALLGMAAIAQRQGRDADAFGWYQKVLEIEPKNSVAQSALINASNVDSTATESKIKSMLTQQPEAAHLHAALGNLYAEQNQWPAAQEAYFNASRYAPNNADYAFNLAISLDHLGKSSLALAQYQRALNLVNTSGATSPDRTQLETRIRALQ